MSMPIYEKQVALLEVYQKLHEAEELEKSGVENIDGKEVFRMLKGKYGRKAV